MSLRPDGTKVNEHKEYTYDRQGNMLSDGRRSYSYDAFGNFTLKEETIENRFGFTGEQYDPVAGLYYLRARFYNPVIGRFIQEYTYYGDGLNLYSYCQNNPVRYVDPSGHMCADKQATVSYIAKRDGISLKKAKKKYNEYRKQNANLTPEQIREQITGQKKSQSKGTPKPGDYNYTGSLPNDSWRLAPYGAGAHLIERSSVNAGEGTVRPELECYDQGKTPRFYLYGTPENAKQAHLRLHKATREAGINIKGGNLDMTTQELLSKFMEAYSDPRLDGIRGDLRNTSGTSIIAIDVTPEQTYKLLLQWGHEQDS